MSKVHRQAHGTHHRADRYPAFNVSRLGCANALICACYGHLQLSDWVSCLRTDRIKMAVNEQLTTKKKLQDSVKNLFKKFPPKGES
jgi:hypothetical protein